MSRLPLGTGKKPDHPKPEPASESAHEYAVPTKEFLDAINHGDIYATTEDTKAVRFASGNKYQKLVKDINGNEIGLIDVYSVLSAFEVTEPGLQHAIKKLLMPGLRGKASARQDLLEAIQAIERTVKVIKE